MITNNVTQSMNYDLGGTPRVDPTIKIVSPPLLINIQKSLHSGQNYYL